MKILLLTSTFKSNSNRKIPTFVRDQVESIVANRKNVNFHILCPHDFNMATRTEELSEHLFLEHFHYAYPRKFETLNSLGILPEIKNNPTKSLLLPLMFTVFFLRSLTITLKTRPDVIYAHWLTPQGIVACLVSKITKTPFCYTSHSSDVSILRKMPIIGKHIVFHATKRAARVSVVSNRTLSKLKSFFDEATWNKIKLKVDIIPMGTYLPKSNHPKKNFSINKNKKILFIGRLAEKKGLQYCVPAIDKFISEHSEYDFFIAGTGPYESQVRSIISSCSNKDRFHFIGHIDGDEKSRALEECDFFMVPSIITDHGDAEGLPVSLLEGLSYGKICIATYESGADDIIKDNVNGFLVNQKNSDALHKALIKAHNLHHAQRQAISYKAKQLAKNYEWSKISEDYYNFIEQAAYEKNPPAKQ